MGNETLVFRDVAALARLLCGCEDEFRTASLGGAKASPPRCHAQSRRFSEHGRPPFASPAPVAGAADRARELRGYGAALTWTHD